MTAFAIVAGLVALLVCAAWFRAEVAADDEHVSDPMTDDETEER